MILGALVTVSLSLAATLAVSASALAQAAPASFTFVAFGDMPYGAPEKVNPPFEQLIGAINAAKPEFSIHIGDTKSGGTPCSNSAIDQQRAYMNTFESALIYTPGDNEWTDCYRGKAGDFDPLERLAYIRETHFTSAKSLGKTPLSVERQSDVMAKYRTFVENARFSKDGVMFVTAHVVGSNNNFEVRDRAAVMEFFDRDAANVAWLQSSFDKAIDDQSSALVLAIHADMFEFGFNSFGRERFLRHSGFKRFGEMLVGKAKEFGKPVLLIYGDSHVFRIFRPFRKTAPNITALEVYGAQAMHAVEITVRPGVAYPFGFRPILNPALG